jgi:hypothetical protein
MIEYEGYGGKWLQHPEDLIYHTFFQKSSFGLFERPLTEQKDLVRLSGHDRYTDGFTRFLWGPCLNLLASLGRRVFGEGSVLNLNGLRMTLVGKAISMVLASMLPTCSILALYFITNNIWRLVFIIAFSVVFTVALAVFTSSTRGEIFIASVGLASVQAVFVGNLIGGGAGVPNSGT